MIGTLQENFQKKIHPFLHEKDPQNGLKKIFKGKLWVMGVAEISATPAKNSEQHSSITM